MQPPASDILIWLVDTLSHGIMGQQITLDSTLKIYSTTTWKGYNHDFLSKKSEMCGKFLAKSGPR